jgi:hypothetical protein
VSTDVSEEHIASIFRVEEISSARNQQASRWRRYVPPKRRLTLNGLHDVVSEKLILFITTAVITSNPTKCSLLHADLSLGLIFNPEDVGDMFLRTLNELHGSIFQKIHSTLHTQIIAFKEV